ncbi:AAA family ATPase [Anaerovibrio lipolyticus]|uniref:AAA family ATPase n=1 Tax=Anaerovibrio lipolyticus TaxID=82374 RepID=UPI0026ED8982|nr:AAA family ATPase [Anaerovibrio lipolyticus]MBE6106414.1 ATP-binding cassette domain-containing protein [Anaerovibrio lipolyticus]
MLKSIEFSGGFFENNTKMELFLNNDRLQSIYGKNGSGKSTLTNAILKAKGDDISDISCAHIFDENNEEITKTDNIYVFNERYIDEKVKISDDGLDTILLLGDLVGIEDKIKTVSEKKEEIAKRRESQEEKLKKYEKVDSPESPQYFLNKIVSKLSGVMVGQKGKNSLRVTQGKAV